MTRKTPGSIADVIEEVCEQAWPAPRDADELHDVLLSLCVLPVEEAGEWSAWADELLARNRLAKASWQMGGVEREGYVPAERMALIRAAIPGIRLHPKSIPFQGDNGKTPAQDEAVLALVRGWMEASGPVTAEELASRVGLTLLGRQYRPGRFGRRGSGSAGPLRASCARDGNRVV